MDIVDLPVSSIGDVDLSLSGGEVVITIKIKAKEPIDALLDSLAKQSPSLAPIVALVKGGVDAALS